MIHCWRLCRGVFRETAFDGEGARRYGGRWNPPGYPLIYTSESLALAALEILVHVDTDLAPLDFIRFELRIPLSIALESVAETDLPGTWRSEFPSLATQTLGEAWLRRGTSAVLRVPSVVIPGENNYLLNPLHGDFAAIGIAPPRPFAFDARLLP